MPENASNKTISPARTRGSALEVLLVFLRLGCTSFGGPIAHFGYYRKEFVERRKWCGESTLAEFIAIAQSLPGPASSQVCFAMGIFRAGWAGGLAAWIGFTLPSAVLMLAFAYGHSFLGGSAGNGLLHGLQLVAVAVVAQAVLGMQRSLAPDRIRIAFAILAAGLVLFLPAQVATLIAIAAGAVAGLLFFRRRIMAIPIMPALACQSRRVLLRPRFFSCSLLSCRWPLTCFLLWDLPSFRLSTAAELWSSAADMWCCLCLKILWWHAGGCRSRHFSPDMAPLRLFPALFSQLPHSLARRCVPPPIPFVWLARTGCPVRPRFTRHDSSTALLDRDPSQPLRPGVSERRKRKRCRRSYRRPLPSPVDCHHPHSGRFLDRAHCICSSYALESTALDRCNLRCGCLGHRALCIGENRAVNGEYKKTPELH